MAVSGVGGTFITGTLSDGQGAIEQAKINSDRTRFEALLKQVESSKENESVQKSVHDNTISGVASSQLVHNHRLNGDYTQGFSGYYTAESDKTASPEGFAANSSSSKGKKPVIDRTSELYTQSKELENYFVKIMLSSERKTIQKSDLFGKEDYARDMYEDMMYDNYAEQITKNAHLGLADQIYIELSGQRS